MTLVLQQLIYDFVNSSENLRTLLRKRKYQKEPVLKTMGILRNALSGEGEPKTADLEAEKMELQGFGPDLQILFFSLWAHLSIQLGRYSRARVLLNRCSDLLTPRTPPEVRSFYLWRNGFLKSLEGTYDAYEQSIVKILKLLSSGA